MSQAPRTHHLFTKTKHFGIFYFKKGRHHYFCFFQFVSKILPCVPFQSCPLLELNKVCSYIQKALLELFEMSETFKTVCVKFNQPTFNYEL
jgi:hypothetical protein